MGAGHGGSQLAVRDGARCVPSVQVFPPGCVPGDQGMKGCGAQVPGGAVGTQTKPICLVWEQPKTTRGDSHPDGGLIKRQQWGKKSWRTWTF